MNPDITNSQQPVSEKPFEEATIVNRAAYIVRIARGLLVEQMDGILSTFDIAESWNPHAAKYTATWKTDFPALGVGSSTLKFTPISGDRYRLLVTSVIPDFNLERSSSGVESDETRSLSDWACEVRRMPTAEKRRAEKIRILDLVADELNE